MESDHEEDIDPADPIESVEAADPIESVEAIGPIEPTGEPRVDDALRRLSELGDRPVSEHPPVFERVHASLVDVLGELRSGSGEFAGRGE